MHNPQQASPQQLIVASRWERLCQRIKPGRVAQVVLLAGIVFLVFYPFIFAVQTSLKTTFQFYRNFWLPSLPQDWALENYTEAWGAVVKYVWNSIFVVGLSVLGTLACGTTSAFVFARYRFPGRNFLFWCVVATMMVPWIVTLVPAFLTVKTIEDIGRATISPDFQFLNTYWVMILPYIAGSQVLAIFLMRSFFASLPQDYFDAARIDGAGMHHMFLHIALPLSLPSISTVAIITTLGMWNNFMWPLVTVSSPERQVLPVGLFMFAQQFGNQYGPFFAGILLGSVPLILLFMFCNRVFLKGVTAGAFKM